VRTLPLDLHVLGTPPAFILSQDQTLQKRELILFTLKRKLSSNELTLMSARGRADFGNQKGYQIALFQVFNVHLFKAN
jgi:hypothetical protein